MVLIVDDNLLYVNRLQELLHDVQCAGSIRSAHNYDEAIHLIARETPQVVLLDINMPGKSGIEVLRFIKDQGWSSRVIVVSNHSQESYRKICLMEGADYFLDKTREFGLVTELVEKLCA